MYLTTNLLQFSVLSFYIIHLLFQAPDEVQEGDDPDRDRLFQERWDHLILPNGEAPYWHAEFQVL